VAGCIAACGDFLQGIDDARIVGNDDARTADRWENIAVIDADGFAEVDVVRAGTLFDLRFDDDFGIGGGDVDVDDFLTGRQERFPPSS
jgi:hypothetical protein